MATTVNEDLDKACACKNMHHIHVGVNGKAVCTGNNNQ